MTTNGSSNHSRAARADRRQFAMSVVARSPRLGATYARTSGACTDPKSPSLGALSTAARSGSASTSAV